MKHVLHAQSAKFLIFLFSQGNAATHLSCGGKTNMGFVGNLLLFAAAEEFCKSSRIDIVIAMVRVAQFFGSQCINGNMAEMLSLVCRL